VLEKRKDDFFTKNLVKLGISPQAHTPRRHSQGAVRRRRQGDGGTVVSHRFGICGKGRKSQKEIINVKVLLLLLLVIDH
jgi:hypothetical protein